MNFINTLRFSLLTLALATQAVSAATINIAGTADTTEEMGETITTGDFNCDNFDDVAVGTGSNSNSQINILYGGTGSGGRLGTSGNVQFTAIDLGIFADGIVPLAAGDFDGDGCDDLAAGFPNSSVDGAFEAGQVLILYGRHSGLINSPETWDQNETGVADTAEQGDNFGGSLAVGDFNSDGYDDLAIGVPGENADAGAVHVLHGQTLSGLVTFGSKFFDQNSSGIAGGPESFDRFGASLASGNFSAAYDDLAIGVPGEDLNGVSDAGAVHVLYGSSSSLSGTGSQLWAQGSDGLPNSQETNDEFGYTLAAGDFNDDNRDDLVIGVPNEDNQDGAIHVLYGTSTGITASGDQYWPGNYRFGQSLAVGDFNNNGRDDLAIGKPEDEVTQTSQGAGSVRLFYGTASGLTTTTSPQSVSQGTSGAEGDPEYLDHFGQTLAAGDFDNNGYTDLAVGVPEEDVGSCRDCGVLQVFYNLPLNPGLVLQPVDDQMFAQ